MRQRNQCVLLLFALAAATCSPAAHAEYASDQWDDGSVNGWMPATIDVQLSAPLTGGVLGGYLQSVEVVPTFQTVGAVNAEPRYTGDFAARAIGQMQVAVQLQSGIFGQVMFQIRYLDGSHNGWYYSLPVNKDDTGWQSFAIEFDPTWSDTEAQNAGWVQEGAAPSFAETLAQVYTIGIRATGADSLALGIDSFSLGDPETGVQSVTWSRMKAAAANH